MARNKGDNSIEPSQKMRQLTIGQKGNAGGEVVIYNPNDSIRLEVRLENETVWLNGEQLSILFNRDKKTIGKHINNALQEELMGCQLSQNLRRNRDAERAGFMDVISLTMLVDPS